MYRYGGHTINMAEDEQSQDNRQVISTLQTINCCARCILRFINEKDQANYEEPLTYIDRVLQNISEESSCSKAKMKKMNSCSACLGLLQIEEYGEYMNKIIHDVNEAGYDSDEVFLALSLPISLLLRNFAIWLYITRKFKKFYADREIFENLDSFSDELRPEKTMVSLKEAWKTLVAPIVAKRLNMTLSNGADSSFHVTIHFEYSDDSEETVCMASMHPEVFATRGSQRRKYHNDIFTRKSVEQALECTDYELFSKHSPVPPIVPSSHVVCTSLSCMKESLYIAGRYNKFSRTLSQTPWVIGGQRRMESSVEELIRAPVALKIKTDAIKFSSSGREDVDVRMLGTGRPFVLDLQNPRRTKLTLSELQELQNAINRSTDCINIRDLQTVHKDDLIHIKTGERNKTKTYNCLCVAKEDTFNQLPEKLAGLVKMEAFVIQQRTPIRVLHRRPLAIRPRTVHWIQSELGNTDGGYTYFTLKINVEAGTYIKELVHGDFGRTVPSITGIIGIEIDILALDVLNVDLKWPPELNETTLNGSDR